jgi:hypothetical protein
MKTSTSSTQRTLTILSQRGILGDEAVEFLDGWLNLCNNFIHLGIFLSLVLSQMIRVMVDVEEKGQIVSLSSSNQR